MDYRDDREALQNKVGRLEEDLAEARRDAAGDEAVRQRAQQLEAEVGALRQAADRMQAELQQLRPAPPRRPPGQGGALAVGGLVVVCGVGASVLVLRSAPSSPPPLLTPVVAPPQPVAAPQAVDLPEQPTPPTPPTDVTPPRPPQQVAVLEGKMHWRATVKHATGLPLTAGSPCAVDATFHAIGTNEEWPDVVVTCGGKKLYDSNDSLNGMAQKSADPLERFGPKDDTSVFTLKYDDKGTRGDSKNQIVMDSTMGMAVVWSENLPPFKVELAMPVESDPAPPIALRLSRAGIVTDVEGKAPVKPGARCTIRALPNGQQEACIADVACGGHQLVKPTDAIKCSYDGARPSGFLRTEDSLSVSVADNDAMINTSGEKFDKKGERLPGGPAFGVTLKLNPAP